MVDFRKLFNIKISPDKLTATIQYIQNDPNECSITAEQLLSYINERGITYGINEEIISDVAKWPEKYRSPVVFAKGENPTKGDDGYLKSELSTGKVIDQKQHFINLREVKHIPSVAKGEKVAVIIAPTKGEDGCNIFSQKIPGKSGKPFVLRPGKNIEVRNNEVFAAIDGQISFGERTINVFPMFEVRGDLDLKTGNIDFIGNVVIRGNVPTGYTVKSRGDIHIYGLVEGATLIAGGSIYITGGIAALNRGSIKAGVDIHTYYINQASVEAGRNIEVVQSILHSKCIAGGDLFCNNGTIVGGVIAVGKILKAKTIGNRMHTKTELFFGINEKIAEQEKTIQQQLRDNDDIINRLEVVTNTLSLKLKQTGKLTDKEKQTLVKGRNTIAKYKENQKLLREELNEIYLLFKDLMDAELRVFDVLYPNTIIHFGKYTQGISQSFKAVKIKLVDNEFAFLPL